MELRVLPTFHRPGKAQLPLRLISLWHRLLQFTFHRLIWAGLPLMTHFVLSSPQFTWLPAQNLPSAVAVFTRWHYLNYEKFSHFSLGFTGPSLSLVTTLSMLLVIFESRKKAIFKTCIGLIIASLQVGIACDKCWRQGRNKDFVCPWRQFHPW